eukprot:gene20105-22076_t
MASPREGNVVKGRGRGRGLIGASQLKTPGSDLLAEKSVKDLILQLKQNELQKAISFLTRPALSKADAQNCLNEAVFEICERVLRDVEFVELAVELLLKLWVITEGAEAASIRKPLISRLQELYKAKDNLLEGELRNYSTLLCDLFCVLKIGGKPIRALTGPVYKCLQDLVERSKMKELLTFIRDAAIKETQKLRKCIFLEVIELKAQNWTLPQEIRAFYSDIMAEIMASD